MWAKKGIRFSHMISWPGYSHHEIYSQNRFLEPGIWFLNPMPRIADPKREIPYSGNFRTTSLKNRTWFSALVLTQLGFIPVLGENLTTLIIIIIGVVIIDISYYQHLSNLQYSHFYNTSSYWNRSLINKVLKLLN